jgi:proline dehydrogenase
MFREAAALLARKSWFRKFIMSTPVFRELAGRFVGGEDLPAGLAAVRRLNSRGLKASLNFHGMHVLEAGEAEHAAEQAIKALQTIQEEGIDSHVSVKLTKIGLDLDGDLCRTQLRRIMDCAASTQGFVRIDMEESGYVEETLRIIAEMQERYGGDRIGIAIQSYLRHRPADLDRLIARGARIRLVKGGYREPGAVVFRTRSEVDAAFLRDIERLLSNGLAPAIATHDEGAIAHTLALQRRIGLAKDAFEFQMLYGVKPDLQADLLAAGYAVRCYVPYGGDWATHLIGCLRRIPGGALARLNRQGSSLPLGHPMLGSSPLPGMGTTSNPGTPGRALADQAWCGMVPEGEPRGTS